MSLLVCHVRWFGSGRNGRQSLWQDFFDEQCKTALPGLKTKGIGWRKDPRFPRWEGLEEWVTPPGPIPTEYEPPSTHWKEKHDSLLYFIEMFREKKDVYNY